MEVTQFLYTVWLICKNNCFIKLKISWEYVCLYHTEIQGNIFTIIKLNTSQDKMALNIWNQEGLFLIGVLSCTVRSFIVSLRHLEQLPSGLVFWIRWSDFLCQSGHLIQCYAWKQLLCTVSTNLCSYAEGTAALLR